MAHTDNPDLDLVALIVAGQAPAGRIRYREAVAAARVMAVDGYTDAQIAARIRRSSRQVLRIRRAHDLPALPLGTNGYTRRHDDPLPMIRTRTRRKVLP